jgi:hypothetical protein
MHATTTTKETVEAKRIIEQRVVTLWREFAQRHINDAGMTGAEIDVLTKVAAILEEVSHPIVKRVREIACNHQLIESWMI